MSHSHFLVDDSFLSIIGRRWSKEKCAIFEKRIYKKVFEKLSHENGSDDKPMEIAYRMNYRKTREKLARVTVDFVWSCGPILFAE